MAEEKVKKNNFIELEFTAKLEDGTIFDTNIPEQAKKLNIKEVKPLALSIGHDMIIKGLDKELEEKEIGKKYSVEIQPEEAFGLRNKELIKMISLKQFTAKNIQPQRGMQLNLDGAVARILSVSGGRVLVDFNNPLAGKKVIYDFKINKKVTNTDDKINALQDFFFRKRFNFIIDKNKKTIIFKLKKDENQFQKFIEMMSKPFDEILKMKIRIEKEKKED